MSEMNLMLHLGIQTEFQDKRWKTAYKAVREDSTHGTNEHKFLLVTLMVIGDFGSGIPVAWLIKSSKNQETQLEFFEALETR